MTNFILLIGAGLFSKAVGSFQSYEFNHLYAFMVYLDCRIASDTSRSLGADVGDLSGDGPGTFDVRGNVWHLDCCNAEDNLDGKGWLLFGALLGWTNSATRRPFFAAMVPGFTHVIFTVGTVLSYVFYWIAAIITLAVLKWREGRVSVFGFESTAGKEKRARQAADTSGIHEKVAPLDCRTDQISELPK